MSNDVARGGTELMLGRLQESLPELCEKVQIICSRPELVPHEDKPRILWLHDLPQDPASQCLRDPSYRTKFNRIVFVFHVGTLHLHVELHPALHALPCFWKWVKEKGEQPDH